ncbi:hypothetical protein [Nocardioides ochotonae]|uniref:hypothetical protein n=1 Tax=Nocardioides ochotonae TaxID=2685869 RepID=UPI00140AB642|nr:hypothetical protein [Nocardioides ochotonae]
MDARSGAGSHGGPPLLLGVAELAATETVPILEGPLGAAILLDVSRVLSPLEARRTVDIEFIVVIASAFGLAAAMQASGLAPQSPPVKATQEDLSTSFGPTSTGARGPPDGCGW